MKNFLQVNRALAAEKNLNYFNLNQIKSNPDGQPTVNRQSRLMSYQGWFRNLAMIFAVLVMSIANIGTAWAYWYLPANIHYAAWNNGDNQMGEDNKLVFHAVPAGTYYFRLSSGTKQSGSCINTAVDDYISAAGWNDESNYITTTEPRDIWFQVVDETNWKVNVWTADPSYMIKYPWGGGAWEWSKPMTSNGDGTYSCVGQYGGTSYNKIKKTQNHTTGDSGTATKEGSISNGNMCVFTYTASTGALFIRKTNDIKKTDHFYFDNTNAKWSETHTYFVIGRPINDASPYSTMYGDMNQISNTNLWYSSNGSDNWTDAAYFAIAGGSSAWDSKHDWGPTALSGWDRYSAPCYTALGMVNGGSYVVTKADGSNGGAISVARYGSSTGYGVLNNLSLGFKYALSTNGGSTYSDMSSGKTPGKITMDWYKFNAVNTVTSQTQKKINAGESSSYNQFASNAGYRTKTTLEVSDLQDGYEFVGWYDGDTEKSTATTYTYYPAANCTITARFKSILVTSITLNKTSTTLTAGGDTETLTTTVLPANALDKTVTWSTSNSSIATVSNGVVTPRAEGSCTITATAHDGSGKSATCTVTVEAGVPTHTLTWNLDGGTATGGTAAGSVAEGAALTPPTVTKVGYDFAGWSPAVPATMPSSDATYMATWTKVYASGTYQFDGNETLGTLPNQATCGTGTSSNFRIDNIFFSGATWEYEGTAGGDGNNYKGWKWKTSDATIKFHVEENSDVTIGIGTIKDGGGVTVTYTDPEGTAHNNTTLTAATNNEIEVKGGTLVTITHNNSGNTVTLKKIIITAKAACTSYNVTLSNSGSVTGGTFATSDATICEGETATLTATPATGYTFTSWSATGTGSSLSSTTTNPATLTMGTADVTVNATFTLKTYTVSFAASPAGYGSVSPTSIASVPHGSEVSISSNVLNLEETDVTATATTSTAAYTYAFSGWSVSNGAEITEAQTITATFTRTANSYDVTLSYDDDEVSKKTGSTGTDAATYGTDYVATFQAKSGFTLQSDVTVTIGESTATKGTEYTWSVSEGVGTLTVGGSYITDDIEVAVDADADVTTYSVTYAKPDGATGTPPADATAYDSGDEVTVKANTDIAKAGTTFRGWTDGTTFYLVGQKFNITSNVTLTAVLEGESGSCYEWAGTPSSWTDGSMTADSKLVLTSSSPEDKVPVQSTTVYGSTTKTNIKVGGDQQYVEGHISDGSEITGLTIHASNNNGTANTDKYYLVLFCSSSSFSTGVTGEKYLSPSYKDDYNASKIEQEITVPSGTKYFRVYRKLKSDVGDYDYDDPGNDNGDGQTIQIFYIEVCKAGGGSSGFTVSFADQTGFAGSSSLPADIVGVPNGKKIVQPADPTAAGYTFGGWYSDAACTGGNEINWGTMTITADKTIYAKWEEEEDETTYYLVTSTAQLNTTDTYVIMDDGKAAMMGVYGENAMTAITSGFTAAADKSTVTVSSSDVNTLTLQAESSAWNIVGKDDNKLTTNSTIGAKLFGNTPKATEDSKDDFVFEFGSGKATIKRNTTTDYHIYYTSGTGFNQSTSSTNIRLYTSNSTPVYTVTYDLNGGEGTLPTNRPEKSGTSITLASSAGLTKAGNTFDGWLCSVNSTKYAAGASYTMTAANTTFTAQWEEDVCSPAELAYATGEVEKNVGDAAFTNTLTNPNSLSVTYSSDDTDVATVNETSGMVTIVGAGETTITATWAGNATYCAGTATYTLTVSSGCTPQSLSKVVLSKSGESVIGTATGYNDNQYTETPVIKADKGNPDATNIDGKSGDETGYKMGSGGSSIVFAVLKGTTFQAGDVVKIGITRRNDTRQVDSKYNILTIYYGTNKDDATALTTITTGGDNDNSAAEHEGAGFYTYTLTASDVTTIGSKKGIGLFRASDNGENPYVYSVEIIGCREWAVCTAPDAIAAGSVTGEGATFTITDALNTNNYEIYYSTSSTAPTAETSATISGLSAKTRAVTGLEAVTTYYYWVRSNCGGVTKSSWVAGTPASFTTEAAAATHSVTYNDNDATSGSAPTDDNDYEEGDVVTVLGNTGSLVKTGETFLGWSTNATPSSGTFYPAGYKFYMPNAAVTLYAVWGSTGATCVTLTDFETSSYDKSSGKPDSEDKYFYGYKGTKSATYAVTITTPGTGTVGANGGDNLQMAQNTRFNIYADNTTTGGTPATFSSITSISFKIKAVKNTRIPTIDVYVGSTKVRTVIGGNESSGTDGHEYDTSEYTTISITGLASLSGIVKFVNTSSGSADYKALFDDIQICYGSGAASGFTVSFDMNDHGSAIADIENVPSGSKIGAPIPSPTAVGVEFGGWYNEEGCSSEWNFATGTITADKTLYAKWTTCAPSISAHPVAATYTQGDDATALSVTASGEDLNYQWYTSEDGSADISGSSAIPGATSASYEPSTALLGTIYYFCVVSNTCGNAVSNKAAITVNDGRPTPTANWTIEEPEEGGKGFTFSIEVNKNNGDNWDGELLASMLTLSDNAILDASSIVVDNTNKTISGTYGVKAGSSSPVTFYLLLPATATQSATRLDQDRTFTPCAGGAGDSYNVPVRKDYEKDASNNYRWVTPGAGEITYAVSSSISSAKAASTVASVFDYIMSNDKQYVWVKTYEANTKTIRLYVETSGANVSVNTLYKNTVYATAADKDIVSSDDYTVSYDGDGSAENTGTKGTHYIDITFDSPLDANDIICIKFSSSKVKAYGAVLTTVGDGGDQTTGLTWSNSQDSGDTVEKQEDAADFTITAVRDATALKSLGLISYTSSNTAIATIDGATGLVHIADNIDFGSDEFKTTTITATLAASGCYKKAVITYILKVIKHVCPDAPGTITYVDRGCSGMDLTLEGYEEGATIQWYKNGSTISGATSATYNATEPGEYYAVTHKTCDITSTNSVTMEAATATAEKIVDSWYVKNGRRTPDIALVQTKNATSFTVTSGGTPVENIGGCTFELKEDGIIYLHGQKEEDGSAPSDMTAGDMTITITVSGCEGALSGLNITIHKQAETAKPSVAFVVDGTLRKDGGTATSVSEAKTSDRDLWKYLNNTFALTGCNVYWSVDSKELREYYSQFDAILITDDPSTQTNGTGGVPYVKAFGTMVDVRPILTMEAFVGRYSDGGWHVYNASPSSPNPRQVEMKLECKNHDIFKGLDPETSDNVRVTRDEYDNEYWHVIMVDTTVAPYHNTSKDYKDLPALQGFDPHKFDYMLGVGTIAEETLQGGVERQEEPAARMMILGIQNEAMAALTNEGKLIVKNAIEYLLKTNMEDVNDCANYFTGGPSGTGDNWATPENWSSGKVPDFESRVRILRPVVISGDTKAIVARVDIATSGTSKWVDGECNGKVTVNSQGALIVSGKIRRADAPHFGIDNLEPTQNNDLIVKAATDTHKQGALIFDNSDGDTHAVVEMWNPSYWEVEGGKKKKYWSYVAVPIQEADIPNFFWHGFTYLYDETSGWIKKGDGTSLYPFQGIGASLQEGNMETFYGPLATTESQDITLTYTADKGQGMNLIGNSWTAPIQIANFEEDDFGDAAAEVWVFNTGNKNDGTPGSGSSATAGQWNTIPINSAGLPGYEGLKVIPAMQAFEVNTTSETTLHLDYDRLVRAGRENLNEPMRAPRRSAAKQIEATMRVRVSGESTHTDVYLLKDARFSDGFDNGWDGHFLSGDNRSARLYAISEEEGALAFMAQPEIEGTQLGFAPSKEGNEYTFSFSYDGDDEYYLNDLKLTTATLISAENSYLFTYEEGDTNRFYISRQPLGAPAVATGVDNPREEIKPRKFIYKDKMYILYNGRVFDATGKVVK